MCGASSRQSVRVRKIRARVEILILTVRRAQGGHDLFLLLRTPYDLLPIGRLRCRTARQWRLSVLRGSIAWAFLCNLHIAHDQRLRWIPALRGWHYTFHLAPTNLQHLHVPRQLRSIASDVQRLGWAWAGEYCWHICGCVPLQRLIPRRLYCHAAHTRHRDTSGALATAPYLLRRAGFCAWTGYSLPIQ